MVFGGFIFGLLGSLHCLGMCGPIAFMLPLDRTHPSKKIFQMSLYHLGRIISYGIIGLLFGALGEGLQLFGLQQQLSIFAGIIMIVLVLFPANRALKWRLGAPIYRLVQHVKNKLGKQLKERRSDTLLTIGLLNGFLPCGLVYMAAIGAVAIGALAASGLYMLLFGLGTIPMMTAAIYFGNAISVRTRQRINRLIPVAVVLIGLLFILRGLGLGIPYFSPAPMSSMVDATMECGAH